jgi:hypothetical protein
VSQSRLKRLYSSESTNDEYLLALAREDSSAEALAVVSNPAILVEGEVKGGEERVGGD